MLAYECLSERNKEVDKNRERKAAASESAWGLGGGYKDLL